MTNLRNQIVSKQSNSVLSTQVFDRLIVEDLEAVQDFIHSHVSDFSGYHYNQFLLHHLHKLPRNVGVNLLELVQNQFHFADELFSLYPDRESIFLFRRFLIQVVKRFHNNSLPTFIELEKIFIENCNCNHHDCVEYLTQRHKEWLNKSGMV